MQLTERMLTFDERAVFLPKCPPQGHTGSQLAAYWTAKGSVLFTGTVSGGTSINNRQRLIQSTGISANATRTT